LIIFQAAVEVLW